ISLGRCGLHLSGAAHGINDARELGEQAVPGRLDNAPTMPGDRRPEKLAPVSCKASQRLLRAQMRRHPRKLPNESGFTPRLQITPMFSVSRKAVLTGFSAQASVGGDRHAVELHLVVDDVVTPEHAALKDRVDGEWARVFADRDHDLVLQARPAEEY